jgi:hypothetical protein
MRITRIAALATGLSVALIGTLAGAQPASTRLRLAPLAPVAPLPSPLSQGEPSSGAGVLDPWTAMQPLRLSLMGSIFPLDRALPNCESREEASGNSVSGMPVQRVQSWRLAPRLSLHGFSSDGCPVDGGLGGGVTYAAPLRPSLWLVAGAGGYGVPAAPGLLPPRAVGDVRIDLVKQQAAGRSIHLGLEQKLGPPSLGAPFLMTFGMSGF